ncbi:MAG: peptidoglycan DD-metalloendopeptidase family protein [Acidobacteriota bacterium]
MGIENHLSLMNLSRTLNDPHRVEDLTSGRSSQRADQLRKATQEFEALFLSYMLRVMRSTVEPADPEASSFGKDVYLDMFDQEIALRIAQTRSLGIGDMMYRQLGGESAAGTGPVPPASSGEGSSLAAPDATERQPVETSFGVAKPPTPTEAMPGSLVEGSDQTTSQNAISGFALPVQGTFTSAYGVRSDPLTGMPSFHQGLDIAAPAGTPFQAVQAGTVVFSGYLRGFGNTILVEHENGYRSLYAHASERLVRTGDVVQPNQVIGLVGQTGRATGTHLHFELHKGDLKIDPQEFLISSGDPLNH